MSEPSFRPEASIKLNQQRLHVAQRHRRGYRCRVATGRTFGPGIVQPLDDNITAAQFVGDDGETEVLIFPDSHIREIRCRFVAESTEKLPTGFSVGTTEGGGTSLQDDDGGQV